jgi:hypothetical protein
MRYLATLNFDDFMTTNARESITCAANRWGMQYLEITHPWTSIDYADIFRHKLAVCDFPAWRWGDEVTLIDGDIIVREDAPYPFTSTPTFAGVHGLQDAQAGQYATDYARVNGLPIDPARYVNGGLLRFYPLSHRFVFERARRIVPDGTIEPMLEQTAMNAVMLDLGAGFEVQIRSTFNTVGEKAWTDEDMFTSGQYVRHFARWKDKGKDEDERRAAVQGCKWRVGP